MCTRMRGQTGEGREGAEGGQVSKGREIGRDSGKTRKQNECQNH